MGTDAPVQADCSPHLTDVGIHLLTKPGDFIDKGNLGREHGVGSVLAHLRAAAIHSQDRITGANKGFVKFLDRVQCFGIVTA